MRTTSKFADQLSALSGRPVLFKDVPALTIIDEKSPKGRPIDPEAAKRAALRRAVAKFNAS